MPQDTRIALPLFDTFKRWPCGGIQDLGEPAVTELLMDWIPPLLTVDEKDRLLGGHLGAFKPSYCNASESL